MKEVLKAMKILVVSGLQGVILYLAWLPLYLFFEIIAERSDPEVWFGFFYRNIYTLLTVIIGYVVIGIILFIIFKSIERFLISGHTKNSYQYMFLPCIFVI